MESNISLNKQLISTLLAEGGEDIDSTFYDFILRVLLKNHWDNLVEHIQTLPIGWQNIYFTHSFEDEIFNGGFNQLFYNSTGEHLPETISSYKNLGITEFEDIATKGMGMFLENSKIIEKYSTPRTVENFSESYKEGIFDQLDKDFYALNKEVDTSKIRSEWIRSNLEKFIA